MKQNFLLDAFSHTQLSTERSHFDDGSGDSKRGCLHSTAASWKLAGPRKRQLLNDILFSLFKSHDSQLLELSDSYVTVGDDLVIQLQS